MDYRVSVMLLLFVLALPQPAGAEAELLPSEMTIIANHQLDASPGIQRRSVTTPLVARVKTDDLVPLERFMQGEVHFLHLEPEPSRDAYWAFRDRDDDLGRVAFQRLMVIRINAFAMVDELLEEDIPEYQRRFGIRPDDRHGISFPVQRTAQLLAERGDAQAALDLIAKHVRQHEHFDAPYTAYSLPGQFLELAAENNRREEFEALHQWALDGLATAIAARHEQIPAPRAKAAVQIPGYVFFSLFADQTMDEHEWTAAFIRLRGQIERGEAVLRGRPRS